MANVHAAETGAQRRGRLEEENRRLKVQLARMGSAFDFSKDKEVRISLPGSYATYLAWVARNNDKTLEDYLIDLVKERVLSEIDAKENDDFAAFFGATLQRDYIEKGPSGSRYSKLEQG